VKGIPPALRALLYVMIVGGCFVAFLVAGRAVWLSRTIERFAAVEGTVSRSEIRNEEADDATLALVADFEVDGQSYQAHAWMGVDGGDDLSHQELVAAHPVGSTLTVYYDPEHPDRATLKRKVEVVQPVVTALALVVFSGLVLVRLRRTTTS
jgi:hypothetical protein